MKTLDAFSAEDLDRITGAFPSLRVAVVGDFFLDKYLDVDPALGEPSIETGKTAHQVVRVRHSPGAAGTVVNNLAALGAGQLFAVGFTGDDGESYDLRKDLDSVGCDTAHLHVDPARRTPTYLKPRDQGVPGLEGEHSRYDTKNRTPTSAEIQRSIMASVDTLLHKLDAVVIADQVEEDGCGAITGRVIRALGARAMRNPRVVFWADSRRRIRDFRNVIIKPNQFEAAGMVNPAPGQTVDLKVLEREIPLLRRLVRAPVFTTAGDRGIYVSGPELTLVPAVRLEGEIDPTGAGDSVTAGCVLSLAAGAETSSAALVGNLVASITVQQLATTGTARASELGPRLRMWQEQRQ